jgi:hypothetical protein
MIMSVSRFYVYDKPLYFDYKSDGNIPSKIPSLVRLPINQKRGHCEGGREDAAPDE